MRLRWILPALLLSVSAVRADQISTFEDLGVTTNPANLQLGGAGGFFTSGGNTFNSVYSSYEYQGVTYGSVSGWAASSLTSPNLSNLPGDATGDYNYQYQAITGGGSGGSATYGVAFTYGGSVTDPVDPFTFSIADPTHPHGSYVNLATGADPISIDVTNTTYDYLSMFYGDGYGKKFGSGDYFRLTIEGYAGADGSGAKIGEVDYDLANFLDADSKKWYIVNDWRTVNLTSLVGSGSLVFGLKSSDNSSSGYGINTPAFFAADNLVARIRSVPEPASLMLCAAGCGIFVFIGRQRRRRNVGPDRIRESSEEVAQ